jgi:3-carboxy-cis,cis-muconate cycloisomerase
MLENVDGLFTTTGMSALFSPEAHIRQMLKFEAALAQAEARAGVIPQAMAQAIAAGCKVELFDVPALYREAIVAGTPAIPLVRQLTATVESEARKYVHWGATSQDAIDTALMLQMRGGLDLLITGVEAICSTCADLAARHRHTLMAGRTLLQQALPITFGLKAARWLALFTRQLRALREQRQQALAVQFGGAAGTLAALGEYGLQVTQLLADELELPPGDLPWHTERDRVAVIATTLGVLAGSLDKLAGDLVLLAQTEVGEVREANIPGKGGSSTLPQKHNPVDAIRARASARLALGMVSVVLSAMAQEQERAAGAWQTEWTALPQLFCHTACAVECVQQAVAGLEINEARMQVNLDLTGGLLMAEALTMALAPHLGRAAAHQQVTALCENALSSGQHLREVALATPEIRTHLSDLEIADALNPANYLGSNEKLIERALTLYRMAQ